MGKQVATWLGAAAIIVALTAAAAALVWAQVGAYELQQAQQDSQQ